MTSAILQQRMLVRLGNWHVATGRQTDGRTSD